MVSTLHTDNILMLLLRLVVGHASLFVRRDISHDLLLRCLTSVVDLINTGLITIITIETANIVHTVRPRRSEIKARINCKRDQ